MKRAILCVVLAVMQASPPVPRRATDKKAPATAEALQNAPGENQRGKQPAPRVEVALTENSKASGEISREGTENTVRIRELPAVSITRDWMDWGYGLFSLLLVIIGGAGVCAAYRSLKAIESQGRAMQGQLRVMGHQLLEVRAAGKQTDRLIEQGAIQIEQLTVSAEAAKASAAALRDSVETVIRKEQARIKIGVDKINPNSQPAGGNGAWYWIENYGLSTAFLDDFRVRLANVDEKEITAEYGQCKRTLYGESIEGRSRFPNKFLVYLEPTTVLTDEDVVNIRNEKSFIHFYGFAMYQDIFGRKKRTTIHLRWTMRWGGMVKGQVMEWWEPAGPPEENADIEDKNPNQDSTP